MSFEIQAADIPALALGSSLLACGGGGNAYYGELIARRLLSDAGAVRVIDVNEVAPEQFAVTSAFVGAPLVLLEKPPSLRALRAGFESVDRSVGGKVGAFVAAEVGGMQSMLPVILAASTGRPLLDGDGMGRAFPEAQMCTFLIYGARPVLPVALSDDHGLLWRLPRPALLPRGVRMGGTSLLGKISGVGAERALRRYCARKGGVIYLTATFDQPSLRQTLVRGSISRALQLGRTIESARRAGDKPVDAVLGTFGGKLLFRGKISDVERRFRGGHDWGRTSIDGVSVDSGRRADISFKNEYLVFQADRESALTVPDLITIVETETGVPVTTDILRVGLRVSVLAFPCSPLLRTPEALRVVGPKAFGYDEPYVPLSP